MIRQRRRPTGLGHELSGIVLNPFRLLTVPDGES